MQTLRRAPLFFCCLPISSIRTATFGGGWWLVIRRLVLRGRCTLPVPTGRNDAFSWRSREFGRKVSPCSARGEQSLRRRKLFASPDLVADFPVIAPPSKAWLSFHGMSSLYRGKIVPHRCSSKKMKCSDRILLCSLDFFPFFKPTRSNTYLRK